MHLCIQSCYSTVDVCWIKDIKWFQHLQHEGEYESSYYQHMYLLHWNQVAIPCAMLETTVSLIEGGDEQRALREYNTLKNISLLWRVMVNKDMAPSQSNFDIH
jgi:hypothetical protein